MSTLDQSSVTEAISYRTDCNGTLDEAAVKAGLSFSSRLIDYQRRYGLNIGALTKDLIDSNNGPLIAVTAQNADEQIVGFGMAHPPRFSRGVRGSQVDYAIENLAVAKTHRRLGVASRIMDQLESGAASIDATSFVIETLSPGAIAFYEQRGYRSAADIAEQAGFVTMRMTLGPTRRKP